MQTYKIQEFEGPLDLLLQMIEQEKVDISKISLATVADQFVQYIEQNPQNISGEELADFLLIATQLLLLKSRLLLPDVEIDDELNPDTLETQLKLYRRFVEAAKRVQTRIDSHQFLYPRTKSLLQIKARFSPPANATADAIKKTMQALIERLRPIVILPESVIEKTVTLQEKMIEIQSLIKSKLGVSFKTLLHEARSKTEKIVCFLALLELVKQEEVSVKQTALFEDILIEKVKENA